MLGNPLEIQQSPFCESDAFSAVLPLPGNTVFAFASPTRGATDCAGQTLAAKTSQHPASHLTGCHHPRAKHVPRVTCHGIVLPSRFVRISASKQPSAAKIAQVSCSKLQPYTLMKVFGFPSDPPCPPRPAGVVGSCAGLLEPHSTHATSSRAQTMVVTPTNMTRYKHHLREQRKQTGTAAHRARPGATNGGSGNPKGPSTSSARTETVTGCQACPV
jgi:hypothetical protein